MTHGGQSLHGACYYEVSMARAAGREDRKGPWEDFSHRQRLPRMVFSQGVTWPCLGFKKMPLMMRLEVT